jgi:hypothetical protein
VRSLARWRSSGMSDAKRAWSLETARAMLAEVRSCTERAVKEVDPLEADRERLAGTPEGAEVEARLRGAVSRWIREMEALGVTVKGLWLVDFDSGSGCYCWRWPEEKLEFYHGRDEGYDNRVRIQ